MQPTCPQIPLFLTPKVPAPPLEGPIMRGLNANLTHAVGSLAALAAQQRPPPQVSEHLDGQRRKWFGYSSPAIVPYLKVLRGLLHGGPIRHAHAHGPLAS